MYVMELQAQSFLLEVRVNDVALVTRTTGDPLSIAENVNPWIVEGENSLRVTMTPGWITPEAPAGEDAPELSCRLIGAPHGAPPPEDAVIAAYQWDPEETPVQSGIPVVVLDETFTPREAFGSWEWEDASAGPVDDEGKNAAFAVLASLHESLASRDNIGVADALRRRNRELARAMDLPVERVSGAMEAGLQKVFAEEDWAMDPIDPVTLVLRSGAGERVFEALGPSGEPFLVGRFGLSREAPGRIALQTFLARIDDEWVIVR